MRLIIYQFLLQKTLVVKEINMKRIRFEKNKLSLSKQSNFIMRYNQKQKIMSEDILRSSTTRLQDLDLYRKVGVDQYDQNIVYDNANIR